MNPLRLIIITLVLFSLTLVSCQSVQIPYTIKTKAGNYSNIIDGKIDPSKGKLEVDLNRLNKSLKKRGVELDPSK